MELSTGITPVVVATIDTGIDYAHPPPGSIPNLFHERHCTAVNDGTNGCYGISTIYYTPVRSTITDTEPMYPAYWSLGNTLGIVGINWKCSCSTCKFLGSDGATDLRCNILSRLCLADEEQGLQHRGHEQ